MRTLVIFTDKAKTKAEITIIPSWLERLFGTKKRRGTAHRSLDQFERTAWFWDVTSKWVGAEIETELAAPEVDDLPPARAIATRKPT